jgi:hypothetical protein
LIVDLRLPSSTMLPINPSGALVCSVRAVTLSSSGSHRSAAPVSSSRRPVLLASWPTSPRPDSRYALTRRRLIPAAPPVPMVRTNKTQPRSLRDLPCCLLCPSIRLSFGGRCTSRIALSLTPFHACSCWLVIPASFEHRMIAPASGPFHTPVVIPSSYPAACMGLLRRVLSSIRLQRCCHLPIPTRTTEEFYRH